MVKPSLGDERSIPASQLPGNHCFIADIILDTYLKNIGSGHVEDVEKMLKYCVKTNKLGILMKLMSRKSILIEVVEWQNACRSLDLSPSDLANQVKSVLRDCGEKLFFKDPSLITDRSDFARYFLDMNVPAYFNRAVRERRLDLVRFILSQMRDVLLYKARMVYDSALHGLVQAFLEAAKRGDVEIIQEFLLVAPMAKSVTKAFKIAFLHKHIPVMTAIRATMKSLPYSQLPDDHEPIRDLRAIYLRAKAIGNKSVIRFVVGLKYFQLHDYLAFALIAEDIGEASNILEENHKTDDRSFKDVLDEKFVHALDKCLEIVLCEPRSRHHWIRNSGGQMAKLANNLKNYFSGVEESKRSATHFKAAKILETLEGVTEVLCK